MTKYKLLKDLPWVKAWTIFEYSEGWLSLAEWDSIEWINGFIYWFWLNNDFLEKIEEKKKSYDDLKEWEFVFFIDCDWSIFKGEFSGDIRSEVFLTEQDAKDELARREWACRKDKFIPKEWGLYYYMTIANWVCTVCHIDNTSTKEIFIINQWLAFRSQEECEKAFQEHDLYRLFYTLR